MRTCSACGTIRPDSQDVCDCAGSDAAPHTANATPVFTMVSFVTTLSVEAVIIYVSSLQNLGIGAIGAVFLVALLVFVGMVINLTTGYLAHKRGEDGGWWTETI